MEKKDLIEKMKILRDKREKEIFEYNSNNTLKTMSVEGIKYLGNMEFMQDGKDELTKKDIFMLIEVND